MRTSSTFNLCIIGGALVVLFLILRPRPTPPPPCVQSDTSDQGEEGPDLLQMARDLTEAARARFPSDEFAGSINDVQPLPEGEIVDHVRETVRRGKYARSSGTIYVALKRRNLEPLSPDVVAGILVHEVAHALTSGSHTPEWREMYIKLLRTATEDLGWTVRLECGACKSYQICQPHQCPRCDWDECRRRR